MAPELMVDTNSAAYQGDKVDIYSFGVLMWSLFTSEQPYERQVHQQRLNLWSLRELILSGRRDSRPDLDHPWVACAPAGAVRLMVQCWDADPDRRPSGFDEVQQRLGAVLESVKGFAKSTDLDAAPTTSHENPLVEYMGGGGAAAVV
jgi:serine/threonine protein kinase